MVLVMGQISCSKIPLTNRVFAQGVVESDSDFLVGVQRKVDDLPFYEQEVFRYPSTSLDNESSPGLFIDQIPTVSSSPPPSSPLLNKLKRALPTFRLLSSISP